MATIKLDLSKDSTMTKGARLLADAIRRNAPHEGIRKNIRIGRREGTESSRFITVLVGKPYADGSGAKGSEYAARAFNIGSGIHGRFGKKYTIKARNFPNLLFFWNRKNRWFRGKSVEHPGVKGTFYVEKSIDEVKPTIKKLLLGDAKQSTRLYLRAAFREFKDD